jgi:hypothetical protein
MRHILLSHLLNLKFGATLINVCINQFLKELPQQKSRTQVY